jgi:purine-nucleoside phosphorylase
MASEVVAVIREWAPDVAYPRLGIVLGSGLGALAEEIEDAVRLPYADLPGFPRSGVSSHRGELVLGRLEGVAVAVFAGRAHYYEHGNAREMEVPIATLRRLGADAVMLTNAAGSLHETVGPGRIMMLADHINWSGQNPLIGREGDSRFVDLVEAYDARLRTIAHLAAAEEGIPLAEGTYMWFSGPSFETPAEIRMARLLGADAVGMSTVPETILARYHGLKVIGFSMVTNLGAGMTGAALSHAETKTEAAKGAADFRRLVRAFVRAYGAEPQTTP